MNEDRAQAAYATLPLKAGARTNRGDCEARCSYHLPMTGKLRHAHHKLAGGEALY